MTDTLEALARKLTNTANGLRGSMWANRKEITALLDEAADTIERLLATQGEARRGGANTEYAIEVARDAADRLKSAGNVHDAEAVLALCRSASAQITTLRRQQDQIISLSAPATQGEVIEVLAASRDLFRSYETHHRAKASEAGRPEKAERNKQAADRIDALLALLSANTEQEKS